MAGQISREYVSVLIPRTRDSRILLVNLEEKGMWMPTTLRQDADTFQTVASKLITEVYHVYSQCILCFGYLKGKSGCEELCVIYLRFKEDTTVKKFNIENVDDVDSKFIYIFFTVEIF